MIAEGASSEAPTVERFALLTLNGSQVRRLQYLWLDAKQEPIYMVETWEPRKTYAAGQNAIKASGGVAESLEVAKFKGGQVLGTNERQDGR